MKERRARAERVAAGHVNDWVSEAQQLAKDVLDLCDTADTAGLAHAQQVEALHANTVAVEERMAAVSAEAADAAERAAAAEAEQQSLRERVRELEYAAANLNAQIIAVHEGRPILVQRDQRWAFKYGSGDVITSFRKAIGRA